MVQNYVILFFIYSMLGWLMEVMLGLIEKKKLVNRGFLIGPYCPIYGTGALLITFLLKKYEDDKVITLIMCILICGVLEYFTSYFMEKLFHARWWDYSKKKANINGRICLETLIPFGILGFIIIYVANPFILEILNKIPEAIAIILAICASTIFVLDNVLSFKIIVNLKQVSKGIKDNTEEISKKVRNIIVDRFRLHRRLIKAFPSIEGTVKIKEWIAETQDKIKELSKKYTK